MGESSRRVFLWPQPALKMSARRPAGVLDQFREDSCRSAIEEYIVGVHASSLCDAGATPQSAELIMTTMSLRVMD